MLLYIIVDTLACFASYALLFLASFVSFENVFPLGPMGPAQMLRGSGTGV
jgi:hypothetical protein